MRKLSRLLRLLGRRLRALIHSFRFTMIGTVFLIMLVSGILMGGLVTALVLTVPESISGFSPLVLIVVSLPGSVLLGTLLSIGVSKLVLRPLDDMILATQEVAKGNFNVEVPIRYEKNQFTHLIKSFNAMTRELSGIEIFRNDFINNFSHEFKTPLSTIRGFARELKNPDLSDAERAEYIEIIISACDRLTEMSSSVLLLSKLENQQFITGKATVDLAEQLRDSILLLENLWAKKNVELKIELDEVSYFCDPESLPHVWQNLLSNAIKYCPSEGGVIEISCKKTDENVIVSISDNGIGMDPETMSHIFEKFYQGDTSHKAEGNGLGLALAARIVKLYGGRIEVESKLGDGSLFRVLLPNEDTL